MILDPAKTRVWFASYLKFLEDLAAAGATVQTTIAQGEALRAPPTQVATVEEWNEYAALKEECCAARAAAEEAYKSLNARKKLVESDLLRALPDGVWFRHDDKAIGRAGSVIRVRDWTEEPLAALVTPEAPTRIR